MASTTCEAQGMGRYGKDTGELCHFFLSREGAGMP